MNTAFTRRTAVLDAFPGLPELYPLLVGDEPVSNEQYRGALRDLGTAISPVP
jgi:hypothetical protein